MIRAWQEKLFELAVVRLLVGLIFFCRGRYFLWRGRQYRGIHDMCWVVRVANIGWLQRIARRHVFASIDAIRRGPGNPLLDSYLADPASAAFAEVFSLWERGGKADLFRDLIVLKAARPGEKGVILLKYARTFSAVAAMLDLPRMMARYTFVLEPCWAGYCDPSILMLIAPGNPVLVQCFTKEDYRYIESVGAPLVPISLGPADWVDSEIFTAPPANSEKIYDLVMVANWGAHKRHVQLFRSLQGIRDRKIRVLLIGFAWANRTADDIRREAAVYGHDNIELEILERVPQAELAEHVARCKAFIFLTRKEGDNKALVEAMFADVPSIVYDKTIGGAGSRVNAATGVFASDEELGEKIRYMLDHFSEFTPRQWALENTGSAASTRKLDAALRQAVTAAGGQYTQGIVEKTNAPNLAYKDSTRRADFRADYDFVLSCLRRRPAPHHGHAVGAPASRAAE